MSRRLVSAAAGFVLGCAGGIGITFAVSGPQAPQPMEWPVRLACGLLVGMIGAGLGAAFRVRL